MPTYTPKTLANMVGISSSSVKLYVKRHASHFSPSANPPKGTRRYFTDDDARRMAFIASCTSQGVNHDEIAERLDAGEVAAFDWMPPAATGQDATTNPQEDPQQETALVLIPAHGRPIGRRHKPRDRTARSSKRTRGGTSGRNQPAATCAWPGRR